MMKRFQNAVFNLLSSPFGLLFWVLILTLLLGLAGCSAKKDISQRVNNVRNAAGDIRKQVQDANVNLDAGNIPAAKQNLTTIDGSAAAIQQEADAVQNRLPDVEDRVPYWAKLLKWGLMTVAIGGVIFVMWRFNLFLVIEKAIQGIVTWVAKIAGA